MMIGGFVLGVSATLVTTAAMSQDPKGGGSSAGGGSGEPPAGMKMPSPEEMQKGMEVWMDAMTPGDEHKGLVSDVGTWDTVTRIWMMGPDAPPTESKGTAESKSVLGGRFIAQTLKYDFPMPDPATGAVTNMPVEGMGMFGYDRYQKMYVGSWADSMSTCLLSMKGNLSPDGKTLTMYGEMDEPMLGVRGRMVKYVTEIKDHDHHRFSIYDLHAGDDYKVVEVDYTRKK